MPWPCFVVASHKEAKQPGAMWQESDGHWLVLLPGGCVHDIHGNSTQGTPWQVTGTAPNFTVAPSIDMKIIGGDFDGFKGWHGWLQNGVLSDDVEGKTY